MIGLRRAKIEDFEIFKILYEEDGGNYHFLYNNDTQDESELEFEICEEDRLLLEEEYGNYTLNRFKDDLETKIIFIAEKDSKIIGYITILSSGKRGTYKIEEWTIFKPNDNESKALMFRELLKQKSPKIRKLLINVFSNSANAFLRQLGFELISSFELKYEVEKKKAG